VSVTVLIGCSVPSVHDAPHYTSLFSPTLFYASTIRWRMVSLSDHMESCSLAIVYSSLHPASAVFFSLQYLLSSPIIFVSSDGLVRVLFLT